MAQTQSVRKPKAFADIFVATLVGVGVIMVLVVIANKITALG